MSYFKSLNLNIFQLFGKPLTKATRSYNLQRNFAQILYRRLLREFAYFQLFLNTHLGFSKFDIFFGRFKFGGSRAFQICIICCNLCIFCFCFSHYLLIIRFWINIWFCKFAIFFRFRSRAQVLFYHNKK